MKADTARQPAARHVLAGLRPEPLASYLAGLGLIRVLGDQADPGATASWEPGGLVIETTIADISRWLAEDYVPTPVLSPWNGGSGFGAKDVEPRRRLAQLLADASPRLAGFRAAADAAEAAVRRARASGWISQDGKVADKQRLVQEFRNRCPDSLLAWIDACVVLTSADKAQFPPLLGTGGNDGRLDFSTNFHEQLLAVLDGTAKGRARSAACARDLLTGSEAERLASAPVGQFDPAGAGGQGSSPFGAAGSLANPWGYVLMVEGALLFAAGVARRSQHDAGRAAMPFTVAYSPDGTASGAAGEESRGEVWAPAWSSPCTLAEISQLFSEARASWRGRPAQRAVDFYAATRALGVARGIDEFVRYGLQQRNGLAFVAVPLDRVPVESRPQVRLAARIEDWVSPIRRAEASRALGTALRQFDAAHLRFARDCGVMALRDLLAALTSLEMAVGRSGRAREQFRVRTPPAAGDFLAFLAGEQEPAELRLAVGIASCATCPGKNGSPGRSMRQILLPLDPADPAHRYGRWRDTALVPGFGLRPLRPVLADVLAWRSRTAADEASAGERHGDEAGTGGTSGPGGTAFRGVPTFRRGIPVPHADLHAFAAGPASPGGSLIDEGELDIWLRACLALGWRGARHSWRRAEPALPVPALALLHPLAEGVAERGNPDALPLALGPDWAVRLAAGQVETVHADAARRLRQAGWNAVPAPAVPPGNGVPAVGRIADGTSLAAALVPRCDGAQDLLKNFAIKIKADPATPVGEPATAGR
ncbi:MAG TPA: type I-U CRISPR-associated protein Csx17 [Streptosporangiaceae bacterium]|nr:type I-U CRISPR-associated protein Csx17 [Streptosporangiaceae bacterium]